MFRASVDVGDPRDFDTLGPLREFVRANYGLVASFGDHDVYVRYLGGLDVVRAGKAGQR
jgi:hypothetical protein